MAKNSKVIVGNKLGLLEGVRALSAFQERPSHADIMSAPSQIDPNPVNAVAAGVLHMSTGGKVGCLLRLEPNKDAKVCLLCPFSAVDTGVD